MTENYAKNENVMARQVAGEDLLIPVCGRLADLQRIFAVNPVARFIWDRLDGKQDAATVAAAVAGDFHVSTDEALRDVREFLDSLVKAGLVSKVNGDG